MRLFALRHGKAGEGSPDNERELTDRGRADVRRVLTSRCNELAVVGRIVHSPLVRAMQTAEIAESILHMGIPFELSHQILPGSEVEDFCDSLAGYDENLLICTHNPFVAELVSYLSGRPVNMPTAACAALVFETPIRGGAELEWLELP